MSINCFLVAFLAGIFLADGLIYGPPVQKTLLVMLAGFILILVLWRKDKIVKTVTVSIIGGVLGLFYFQFFTQKPTPQYISYYIGDSVVLYAKVAQEPSSNARGTKFTVVVNGIKGGILINAPRFPLFQIGDHLKIKGRLEKPPMFDEFNYRNYLKSTGVFAIMNQPEIEKISSAQGFALKKKLSEIKNCFESTLNKILPTPEAELANGLLFGEKRLPNWLTQIFITVGIIHIIALSGYNITIITKAVFLLTKHISPKISFCFSLFVIWLFTIMVGAKATIVRAAIFGTIYLFARRVGRRRDMTRAILLTAFLMTLSNPFSLKYDQGFQLSFLSTAGLIYLGPIFKRLLSNWSLHNLIKETMIDTLSAQLFVLPILILNFKKISLVALPVNLLILPIIPLTMFLVFSTGLLGLISTAFGQIAGSFAFLLLKYIVWVSTIFSKIPGTLIMVERFGVIALSVYWIFLGILIRTSSKKKVGLNPN